MAHHTRNRSSVPIFVGTSIVGCIRMGIFSKKVKGSKHFLAEPRAIAFAASSLEDAERAGANRLEITDVETGIVYRVAFDYFKEHSFEFERGGFEPQRALRLELWAIKGEGRRRRLTASPPAPRPAPKPGAPDKKPEPAQLGLFQYDAMVMKVGR